MTTIVTDRIRSHDLPFWRTVLWSREQHPYRFPKCQRYAVPPGTSYHAEFTLCLCSPTPARPGFGPDRVTTVAQMPHLRSLSAAVLKRAQHRVPISRLACHVAMLDSPTLAHSDWSA